MSTRVRRDPLFPASESLRRIQIVTKIVSIGSVMRAHAVPFGHVMRHAIVVLAALVLPLFPRSSSAEEAPPPPLREPDAVDEPMPEARVRALPCRPTIACTAEIVPGGHFEVEAGYALRRTPTASAAVHGAAALGKYSVTDRLQLQLGTNNVFLAQTGTATRSFDGAFGGPKLVLVTQGDRTPAIAVSALFGAPTTNDEAAAVRTYDANAWVYVSKDALGFHGDINLGLDTLSLDKKPAIQTLAALAVSRDLAFGFGAMIEGYTFNGGGAYAGHDGGVLTALSFSPMPELVLDAGADTALYRDTRSVTFFAGLTMLPFDSVRAGARRASLSPASPHAAALQGAAR